MKPGQAHRYGIPFRTSVVPAVGHAIIAASKQHNRTPDFVIAQILQSWYDQVWVPAQKAAEKKKPPEGG